LTGLVQSSNPETSERHRSSFRGDGHRASWFWTGAAPQTCEVDGLDRLNEIRLLHLKPVQQLGYEAQDVQLRERGEP